MEEMRPANNSRTKRALDNGRFYVDDIRTDKLSHINIVILWNGCYDQAQALIFNHSTPKIVNYPTLRPLSYRNKIGDKFGDATTVTVWEKEK